MFDPNSGSIQARVAMGGKGTEAAKEASEMVLADDNFASIVAAVREGRTVYDNLTKVIAWTLPTNGGEAFTIILAILCGLRRGELLGLIWDDLGLDRGTLAVRRTRSRGKGGSQSDQRAGRSPTAGGRCCSSQCPALRGT